MKRHNTYLGSKRILTECLVPLQKRKKQEDNNEEGEGGEERAEEGEPSHQDSSENSYNVMAKNYEKIIRYVVNNIAMYVILSRQTI